MLLTTCNQQSAQQEPAATSEDYRDPLIRVNKKMVEVEDELINDFIERYRWDMKKTGTGLRYMIYSNGEGAVTTLGKKATILYSVVLLNGDTCYPSLEKSFIIGKEKIEPGLNEGIQMMHMGDKAKFILPSHLAFGLVGDRQSIPQKATLVYDVYLIELSNNKQE